MKTWTEPNRGLSHYGTCGDFRRSSIQQYASKCQLSRWHKGCGFNPETEWFDSLADAQAAGEAWADGK